MSEIFGPYHTGNGVYIHADPFRVRRLLAQSLPADLANRLLDDWSPQAADQFLEAVRVAFGLAAFDPTTGTGATEDAVIDVWNAWQAFCEKKNPTAGISPTSTTPSPALPPLPPWAQKLGSAS